MKKVTVITLGDTPFLAVDNDELGEPLKKGDLIACPHCGNQHEVCISKRKDGEETDMIMFYRCPWRKNPYLCGLHGRNIMHQFCKTGTT